MGNDLGSHHRLTILLQPPHDLYGLGTLQRESHIYGGVCRDGVELCLGRIIGQNCFIPLRRGYAHKSRHL